MAKIIIIYTTNASHEYPSRDEIAEAIRHLHEYGQTQCLNGPCDLEIDTDVVETNQLCV